MLPCLGGLWPLYAPLVNPPPFNLRGISIEDALSLRIQYAYSGGQPRPPIFPGQNFMRAQGGCIHSCGWGKKK